MVELIDGGYCANNPTLYAIADAIMALKLPPEQLRVVSVGVGVYPSPKQSWFSTTKWAQKLLSVQLLQKTLEINTQSMDQLRHILFRHVPTVRISDTFEQPEMATDLFEHNKAKLNILRQRGSKSFAKQESALQKTRQETLMPISEAQLKTWAKQGLTGQFTATYETLRGVLNDSNSPYYPKSFTIFLQGSQRMTRTSTRTATWMSKSHSLGRGILHRPR